jgi:hypothetical protein
MNGALQIAARPDTVQYPEHYKAGKPMAFRAINTAIDPLCLVVSLGLLAAAPSIGADTEFVIQIKDHRFIPAELHVPRGIKIRLVLDNQDEMPEEFDSHSLNREKHVPAKSRVTLFVGPLAPGRYLFEGENHDSSGGAALGVIVVQ